MGPDMKMPANAVNGLYIGSTSKADIRLQVAYGLLPGATDVCIKYRDVIDIILCGITRENLRGTGSITLRETGEVQAFEFSGLQFTRVVLFFSQPKGVMVDAKLIASPSEDGKTLPGMIAPRSGTPTSAFFGDSTAITFVRSGS